MRILIYLQQKGIWGMKHIIIAVLMFNVIFLNVAHAKGKKIKCNQFLKELTPKWIAKMQKVSAELDPVTKRLQNIVQTDGFENATFNREVFKNHNDKYTKELCTINVLDQQRSGRCWAFASKVLVGADISENYIWFYHFLEQVNGNIERAIRISKIRPKLKKYPKEYFQIQLSEGGWQPYFNYIIGKYGSVPKNKMSETAQSSLDPEPLINELAEVITRASTQIKKLTESSIDKKIPIQENELYKIKEAEMKNAWQVLTTHLGVPPTEFEIEVPTKVSKNQKTQTIAVEKMRATITPKEYAMIIDFKPDFFVEIASTTKFAPNTYLHIRNGTDFVTEPNGNKIPLKVLNVENERMKELVMKAIDNDIPVPFACDVKKGMDAETGILHPDLYDKKTVYGNTKFSQESELTPEEERQYGLSYATHEMAIMAYDKPDAKGSIKKFKVQNSWSKEFGDKGYMHMYAPWFDRYVYFVTIPKSLLNKSELTALKSSPKYVKHDEWVYKVRIEKNKPSKVENKSPPPPSK